MRQYLDLLKDTIENGTLQTNRTGISARFIPGAMLKFDLSKGFPIVTTRKAPWKSSVAETIGFLGAYTNAAQFRELGCKFWDANANQTPSWLNSPYRTGEDDLGQIYGYFWRKWKGDDGSEHDQVIDALNKVVTDPTNRRIIVSGWKVDAINQQRGALPPCHISWHLMPNVETKELSLCMWQRSCDMILGIGGGNITGYAFLLEWIARLTGYKPKWLVMHLDDVHVYENHLNGAKAMLERMPKALPKLCFDDDVHEFFRDGFCPEAVEKINPHQIQLIGYEPHESIKFDMAV